MIEAVTHARPGRIAADLVGRAFGRLTVIARAGSTDRALRRPLWRCRCSCGQERVVLGASLLAGRTRSCGCLRVDVARSTVVMARAERVARRARRKRRGAGRRRARP
jgi:hypothetical protein